MNADKDLATVNAETAVLRRRLTAFAQQEPQEPKRWGTVRTVAREDARPALGGVQDIVLEFLVDDVLPDVIKAAAATLCWAVYSHFRAQPDERQTVEISHGGTRVTLAASNTTPETMAAMTEGVTQVLTAAASAAPPAVSAADGAHGEAGDGAEDTEDTEGGAEGEEGEDDTGGAQEPQGPEGHGE